MREFIYMVNGTEYYAGTDVWGKAWKDAKTQASEEHTFIERAVIDGKEVSYEFYAKGGCFLAERFYDLERVKIF